MHPSFWLLNGTLLVDARNVPKIQQIMKLEIRMMLWKRVLLCLGILFSSMASVWGLKFIRKIELNLLFNYFLIWILRVCVCVRFQVGGVFLYQKHLKCFFFLRLCFFGKIEGKHFTLRYTKNRSRKEAEKEKVSFY